MVAMRAEPKIAPGGDVFGQVVEVEGAIWREVELFDRGVVEGGVGLAGSDFVRKVVVREVLEDVETCEEILRVQSVGVGKKDEAVTFSRQVVHQLPHRLIGMEDVTPGGGKNGIVGAFDSMREALFDEVGVAEGSGFVGLL